MDSWETGRLIYLVLLGSVIFFYFVVANRPNLGQLARHGLLWILIFLGAVAGFGLWNDIRNELIPRQSVAMNGASVEVPRAFNGHYYLTLEANGTPVTFVVDTGASDIVLSREDALRVGIDPEALVYSGRARTANGTVRTASTRIGTLALGPIVDRDVTVWINDGDTHDSLLGMSYLQRFDTLQIVDGRLMLRR